MYIALYIDLRSLLKHSVALTMQYYQKQLDRAANISSRIYTGHLTTKARVRMNEYGIFAKECEPMGCRDSTTDQSVRQTRSCPRYWLNSVENLCDCNPADMYSACTACPRWLSDTSGRVVQSLPHSLYILIHT
jgi:hypothetical protein